MYLCISNGSLDSLKYLKKGWKCRWIRYKRDKETTILLYVFWGFTLTWKSTKAGDDDILRGWVSLGFKDRQPVSKGLLTEWVGSWGCILEEKEGESIKYTMRFLKNENNIYCSVSYRKTVDLYIWMVKSNVSLARQIKQGARSVTWTDGSSNSTVQPWG